VIHVGTSGWSYDHWRRIFYPADLPKSRWFGHYASVFPTVELNATFYRLPTAKAVERWREQAPPGFVYAAKGSRYLTHLKRLADAATGVARYFERLDLLRPKLAVVLWQLPPQMDRADPERLERFLELLPRDLRHAFEFRSAAWYTEAICDLLDAHGAAFCEHDLVEARPPRIAGGFRYLRFHGTTGRYGGRYGRRALAPVAESLRAFGGDAFAYFNNDLRGHAVADALELLDLLGEARPGAGAQRATGLPSSAPR